MWWEGEPWFTITVIETIKEIFTVTGELVNSIIDDIVTFLR